MAYVIAEPCVDVHDRACVDECPVDCIYDGVRKGYIHPDECVDCGACEPVCPVTAIFHQEDLPAEWRHYAGIEREFFTIAGLGSPGGANALGPLDADHPALGSLGAA
ncbi:MAG: ferredoxin [Planctomycetaceae bacterium]